MQIASLIHQTTERGERKMKGRIIACMMGLILLFAIYASAVVPSAEDSIQWDNAGICSGSISFSGTTANCLGIVQAKKSGATVTGSITLYRVNSNGSLTWLKSWGPKSGTDVVNVSGSYSGAVSGTTYRLSVSGTITFNGSTSSVSKTVTSVCP